MILRFISQAENHLSIQVYYESLCPDSIDFITQQLFPTFQKLGKYLTIEFKPFGNAKVSKIVIASAVARDLITNLQLLRARSRVSTTDCCQLLRARSRVLITDCCQLLRARFQRVFFSFFRLKMADGILPVNTAMMNVLETCIKLVCSIESKTTTSSKLMQLIASWLLNNLI